MSNNEQKPEPKRRENHGVGWKGLKRARQEKEARGRDAAGLYRVEKEDDEKKRR